MTRSARAHAASLPESGFAAGAAGAAAPTLGEIATPRELMAATVTCQEIDERFRTDPGLSSVVVADRRTTGRLLNRAAFYQSLAGPLGFGWALYHRRAVCRIPAPTFAAFPASMSAPDAALSLLDRPDVSGADDVLVHGSDGSVATLAVARLFAVLAESYEHKSVRLASSTQWLHALLEHSADVTTVLDRAGAVRYVSPSVTHVTGYARDDSAGADPMSLVHPDDIEQLSNILDRDDGRADTSRVAEFRMRVADGSWHWFEANVKNLLHDPTVGGVVVNYRDVTGRRALENELRHRALHDQLTGLANRTLLLDRAGHAIDRQARTRGRVGLVYCDLDGFKRVNDTYGHGAGDELLRAVAERLATCVRPVDTLARIGGDEFAVLLDELHVPEETTEVANRLVDAVREPFRVLDRVLHITMSAGIAVTSDDGPDAGELARRADHAMYNAKRLGRDRVTIWSAHVQQELGPEAVDELRTAIVEQQLVVHYQPILALPDARVIGAEALVRWLHPTRGLVPPAQFIEIAERNSLIVSLGRFVLRAACAQLRDWRSSGLAGPEFVMSVNVSAVQLAEPGIVEDVAEAIAIARISAADLQLEITETALLRNNAAVSGNLDALRRLGVRIALDDFGTGYASLSYLQRFPITSLKIDRSFVERLGRSQDDYLIVSGIVRLAHSLGITVTAEGIETAQQLASLVELTCDHAQGYLFARPSAAADVPFAIPHPVGTPDPVADPA